LYEKVKKESKMGSRTWLRCPVFITRSCPLTCYDVLFQKRTV